MSERGAASGLRGDGTESGKNRIWRRIQHYAHAVERRAELVAELDRGRCSARQRFDVLRYPVRHEHMLMFRRFLDPRDRIVLFDIGGHVGDWAARFLTYFPNTSINAFEPTESAIAYEERFRSNPRVSVYKVALSDRPGTATMAIGADSAFSSLNQYADVAVELVGEQSVQLARLDDFSYAHQTEGIAVVKIDVQGHELAVVSGMTTTLQQIDLLLIETSILPEYAGLEPSFAAVTHALHGAGFFPALFNDYGRIRSPYAVQCDVLYARPALLPRLLGF